MTEITRVLDQIEPGDTAAADDLLDLDTSLDSPRGFSFDIERIFLDRPE